MKELKILFFAVLIFGSLIKSEYSIAQFYVNADSQPYFQGFEGSQFPPEGWHKINVSGNVEWMIGYFAHTGTQAAVCAWQSTGVGEDWLITPRWNIQAGDSLAFWLRPFYTGFPPDSLAVRVSTTDSLMTSFSTRILLLAEGNGYPTSSVYQRYAVSLDQFAGLGIFIAFKHMDQNGDGIFIDDVSIERQGPTGITGPELLPSEFKLSQNFPNPFNPVTNIKYSVPEPSFVSIRVYNTMGQEVSALVNEYKQAGNHEIIFDGTGLTSGIYFYKISTPEYSETKKMMLLK